MVGLSIVLEAQKSSSSSKRTTPQVISKSTFMINKLPSPSSIRKPSPSPSPSSFPVPTFLEECFLCGQKLLPGKDIYMYKGDRGFCSEECRCRQIFMDEEESLRKENCSLTALKPLASASAASSASSSSNSASASRHHHRKSTRKAGAFAY